MPSSHQKPEALPYYLRQRRTIVPASLSRLFAPLLQFEKWEIHTVFLHFSNFELGQKSWLSLLVKLCGVALSLTEAFGAEPSGGNVLVPARTLRRSRLKGRCRKAAPLRIPRPLRRNCSTMFRFTREQIYRPASSFNLGARSVCSQGRPSRPKWPMAAVSA